MTFPQYITYSGTFVRINETNCVQVLNNAALPKIQTIDNVGLISLFKSKIHDENHVSDSVAFNAALTSAISYIEANNAPAEP